jgi:glycerophosphoryl diester phosphodiesterase
MQNQTPLLYGHRGSPLRAVENTLPSFALALEEGATALELDVHLTACGEVVVFHDDAGTRLAGTDLRLAETSFAEIRTWRLGKTRERVPRLRELFQAFPGVPLNIDLKGEKAELRRAVLQILDAERAREYVRLTSFHGHHTRKLQAEAHLWGAGMREVLLGLSGARLNNVARGAFQLPTALARFSLAKASIIRRLKRNGARVDFWVVNDPKQTAELLALGADGIVTDDPKNQLESFVESFALRGIRLDRPRF